MERTLLSAVALSTVGDWLTTVAVAVALFDLSGSVTGPALALLVRVLPRPFAARAAGPIVRRLGAVAAVRSISYAQGLATAALALCLLFRQSTAALVVLGVAQALGAACRPCVPITLTLVVEPSRLQRAMSTAHMIYAVGAIAAPALAGLLVAIVAPAGLVGVDALTFLLAAGVLRAPAPQPAASTSADPPPRRSAGGLRTALGDALLRQVLIAQAGNAMAVAALQGVLTAVALDRLGTETAVGLLYGAVAVGAALGGFLLMHWRRRPRSATALGLATVGELAPLLLLPLLPGTVAVLAGLAVSGFAATIYQVALGVEMSQRLPRGELASASAAAASLVQAGLVAGAIEALLVGRGVGWIAPLEVAAGVALAANVIAVLSRLHAARCHDPLTTAEAVGG